MDSLNNFYRFLRPKINVFYFIPKIGVEINRGRGRGNKNVV